jgi:hypothetical protein
VNRGKFAPAERGCPPELLLRSREGRQCVPGDARQCCSCGAGTPGGNSLADFGRSKRAGDPGSSHPSPGSSV